MVQVVREDKRGADRGDRGAERGDRRSSRGSRQEEQIGNRRCTKRIWCRERKQVIQREEKVGIDKGDVE
jgi:hypothetical protein